MLFNVTEVDRQMAYYKPVITFKKKSDEVSRTQHLISRKDTNEENEETEGF